MKKHKIEIAVDHHEGSKFVAWLNKNGHDAALGSSTGNYVDGERTSSDDDANQILNTLWDKYCNNGGRPMTLKEWFYAKNEMQFAVDEIDKMWKRFLIVNAHDDLKTLLEIAKENHWDYK